VTDVPVLPTNATGYLDGLGEQIRLGLARVPESFREKHAGFVISCQNADGGFSGRDGGSDLYYTSFALRLLAALGVEDAEVWRYSAQFAGAHLLDPGDVIHCFALLDTKRLMSAQRGWSDEEDRRSASHCETALGRFRTSDDCYARVPGEPAGLYHTFLATLCRQLMGLSLPAREAIVGLAQERRRADGGFSDLGETDRGETNPSAAAIALLKISDAASDDMAERAADFLVGMQRADGGFAAHADAPVSDLLSTFTALVSLAALEALDRIQAGSAARFAQKLQCRTGGFHGTELNDEPDVEYTYYGLGVVGLLSTLLTCGR